MKLFAVLATLSLVAASANEAFVSPLGGNILRAQRTASQPQRTPLVEECQTVLMGALPGTDADEARSACEEGAKMAPLVSAMALGLMSAIAPQAAFAAGDPELGEIIFSGNCAACHAGGNNVVQAEKTLKKEALETYGVNTVDKVIYQVTNGKNAMPAFGGRLSEEDIQDVAAYVIDQATGDKW
ncbi:unnamed protein product [Vitrella brassicaformis CCMP3155]|uniref:Cytochrome c-553 n=2 Tax=Vitrella brassicaformis TaxID=1169539 RepID=A0A0G4GN02_VITBC|nr:unnamed protein product [Vitrella brassicaformis CCMP3155]|mmetsp:Transcript_53094/g.133719  ORF Transcript_53094/g.133719 Transcript_53094/m.133719 type:complete len:184 (+) Transcript_53094:128-679(+)|eukprot:CEM31507.1 unnamed protein product [Vitrella brassicaformis CCMP3155]